MPVESSRAVVIVFVLAAAGGGFLLWRAKRPAAPVIPPPIAKPVVPVAPPPPPAPPAKPAIEHPLADEPSREPLPDLDSSDGFFNKALGDLLGNKTVTSFLMLDGFARRVVATVNNLDTDTAAADLWPVARTSGRFTVSAAGTGNVIAPANAERYTPFVRIVQAIDAARAAALYRRAYPLLQKAYVELGVPGHYFNDRVVKVIDHLLATPDLAGPIAVKRAGTDGAATSSGLFLFDDPTLESRSSGQKILLRMGPDNAAKLKAKLTEFRRLVAH